MERISLPPLISHGRTRHEAGNWAGDKDDAAGNLLSICIPLKRNLCLGIVR